jgi:nitrite reductase/ring-hydroxylating ferredoxin subunit
VQRLLQQLPERFPGAYSAAFLERSGFSARVHPLRSVVLGRTTGGRIGIDNVLWLLLGAVSLVLLIACANVANLMLVRAESRRRELTVRAALGAERAHMAVHYLAESLLIAGAAAVVGLTLAFGGVRLLISTAPPTLPRLGDIAVSTNGVLFAIGVSVLTALVFGLVPVFRRGADFGELRESGRGMTPSRDRQLVRNVLVVGQVGMALVLLAAGGLMLRSFLNLRTVQWGGDAAPVLTFDVTLPAARYGAEADIFRFQQQFVERIRTLAGVRHVSATTSLPFRGSGGCAYTVAEQSSNGGCVPTILVLPDYFAALDIDVEGSTFSLVTGEPQSVPATMAVPVYDIRVEGDEVFVDVTHP